MKNKINRKIWLTIFVFLTVLFILNNPMFQSLNLVVKTSQLTISNSNISGLSLQGSCLVYQTINSIQATNTTSGKLVNAFQVNTTIFNFMSMLLMFTPITLYLYFEYDKDSKKESVVKKKRGLK
jgi:hypothetical protein